MPQNFSGQSKTESFVKICWDDSERLLFQKSLFGQNSASCSKFSDVNLVDKLSKTNLLLKKKKNHSITFFSGIVIIVIEGEGLTLNAGFTVFLFPVCLLMSLNLTKQCLITLAWTVPMITVRLKWPCVHMKAYGMLSKKPLAMVHGFGYGHKVVFYLVNNSWKLRSVFYPKINC